jgi:hypothetical protein
MKSWLLKSSKSISQQGIQCLEMMINRSVTKGMKFLKKHRKFLPYPIQDVTVVITLCRILDAFFEFMHIKQGTPKSEFSLSLTDEICLHSSVAGCLFLVGIMKEK